MADGGDRKSVDFYKVLGLEKECTPTELKNAYKKLAKIWHPDRCSASGNSKFVEEAKMKFQAIQEAYSVLSDETKRFLYDVGVYDKEDDDSNHGMGDFLNEMVTMMSEQQPAIHLEKLYVGRPVVDVSFCGPVPVDRENGGESFEQLQEMFEEMFQRESLDAFALNPQGMNPSCSSSYAGSINGPFIVNKRNSSEMNKTEGSTSFTANLQSFCAGMECRGDSRKGREITEKARENGGNSCSSGGSSSSSSRRRYGRKQKVASGHDVSSNDSGIFST